MRRIQNALSDETGIALPVSIVLVVLVSIMGAGLLVFSSANLQTTVEVNQGQRALGAADAGVEAARRELTFEARPTKYDTVNTSDNSSWYDDSTPKELTFDGNTVKVGIRYLKPSSTDAQSREPGQAPEKLPGYGSDLCNDTNGDGVDDDVNASTGDKDACEYPNNRNYFRITVTGGTGSAVRKVQSIYVTQNFDFPIAYYATRDINLQDSATSVSGLSLFANRYITGLRSGMLTGTDQAYGNWAVYPATGLSNPYNSKARPTSAAGAAALGNTSATSCVKEGSTWLTRSPDSGLTYDPSSYNRGQKSFEEAPAQQHYGTRDFDRDSDFKCSSSTPVSSGKLDFRANTWSASGGTQPANTITFPFSTGDATGDAEIIEALKEKADSQGLYIRKNPGESFTINDGAAPPNYPANSDLTDTVMFVEFSNPDGSFTNASGTAVAKGSVLFKARSSDADNRVKGVIVVMNGDFETNSSSDDFQGVIVVRDPVDTDTNVMQYIDGGSLNVEGFVNVEGDINLRGNVDGFLPADLVNGLPGLFKVSQWSWRECYTSSCD